MPRRVFATLFFVAAAALAGCQDYNFNPVGKCVIQPGAQRAEVEKIGTADVLFVVDDSDSMRPEQAKLAANFDKFISALAEVQAERVRNNLDPFEFHIAVTTSSIFEAWKVEVFGPFTCGQTTPGQCAIPFTSTHWDVQGVNDTSSCTTAEAGATCNDLINYYAFPGGFTCDNPGVAKSHDPFPAGNFVAATVNGALNPRVLHFTKDLEWADWNTAVPTPQLSALVQQFKDNIAVGACGASMEQHFEAARLALTKAQGGTQPNVQKSEFLHDNAKLVVVLVGDEDDCSNPDDPTNDASGNAKSLLFTASDSTTFLPGHDVCVGDESKPADQQKLLSVSGYADFLTSLQRPLGVAFVYSAQVQQGSDGSWRCIPDGNGGCKPGTCECKCPSTCRTCDSSQTGECFLPDPGQKTCGGQIPLAESRFHQLSGLLRGKTLADGSAVSTLEASVCDSDWSQTLQGIAKLVAPPSGLTLATQPADKAVVALSIQTADGNPRTYCDGPDPAKDWWFVSCDDRTTVSTDATKCIKVSPNPSAKCQPNPGESYVAFYLGRVPDSGCLTDTECNTLLQNTTATFKCLGGDPTTSTRGTCVCQ